MKRTRLSNLILHTVLPLLITGGAIAGFLMLGSKQKPNRKKPPPRVSVPVDVVRPKPHDGTLAISASGVVVPFREVDLPTEVSGRVVWKSDALLPGRFVSAGQELVRINQADYELEVSALKLQLQKAEADLARVEIDKQNTSRLIELARETLALRTREFRRIQQLQQSQATSQSELDDSEKAVVESKQLLTSQENSLRGLEAQTKSLEAEQQLASIGLEKAKLDLTRTTIHAPFSGVVIKHAVEANSHVQAGDKIATIEDTSKVEVRCNLRKEDLELFPNFAAGASGDDPAAAYRLPPIPVTLKHSRGGRAYHWQGVLSRQDGLGIDPRTRTMPVRILVDNPLDCHVETDDPLAGPIALVRGMFVQVDLHCQPERPLLAIPESSIRPGKTVWIMDGSSLKIQSIRIARIETGTAYIDARDGTLSQRDQIISSPVPGAREGLAVTSAVRARRAPTGDGPGHRQRPGSGSRPEGKTSGSEGERPGSRVRPDGDVSSTAQAPSDSGSRMIDDELEVTLTGETIQ
ncbi:MAG: HlyD family efflux transporter periplasmic adaptor subunit [Planctomycetota bacterium]